MLVGAFLALRPSSSPLMALLTLYFVCVSEGKGGLGFSV